ncbi:MAG: tRNA dihydrouridine synthase DusB, partial [Bacteroidota bacterium]
GERKGTLEMRRMYGGYFKGHRGASLLRQRLMEHNTRAGVLEVLLNFRPEDAAPRVSLAQPRAAKAITASLPRPSRPAPPPEPKDAASAVV